MSDTKICRSCNTERPVSAFRKPTHNSWCSACSYAALMRRRQKNREPFNAWQRAKWASRTDAQKAARREAFNAWQKSLTGEKKEKRRENFKRWHEKNRARFAASCRRYYAQRLKAFPQWANEFFIEEIYDLARLRTKALGVRMSVDHIVPLRSPIVCGLHVEHNLQIIPQSVNSSKRNRWWPDMPTDTLLGLK